MLLCDRPHSRFVDFKTSRFVVGRGSVKIGDKTFERGEEIPRGALDPDVMRMEYEPPLARVEVLEHALKDPDLREACARSGVLVEDPENMEEPPASRQEGEQNPPEEKPVASGSKTTAVHDLERMSRFDLEKLAKKRGLKPPYGNALQLRKRLS
jgi:hypothetical protein